MKPYAYKRKLFLFFSYPLILSIENHCSLVQQEMMAENFKTVFGDMLLKEPVRGDASQLPSPNALMRKIILKVRPELAQLSTFY